MIVGNAVSSAHVNGYNNTVRLPASRVNARSRGSVVEGDIRDPTSHARSLARCALTHVREPLALLAPRRLADDGDGNLLARFVTVPFSSGTNCHC